MEQAKYPINRYGAIYVPDVLILPDKENGETWSSAIAAALRPDAELNFMQEKTDGIIKLAVSKGYKTIILGAWGCGAFANSPEELANAFDKSVAAHGKSLEQVIYAVPGKKGYQAFKKHFN